MLTALIGDVHGRWDYLDYAAKRFECDRCIQLGDFGFYPRDKSRPVEIPEKETLFIRGNHENHDDLPLDAKLPVDVDYSGWKFAPDGYVDDHGFLYIGGAWSIDAEHRRRHLMAHPDFIYRHYENEQIEDWDQIFEAVEMHRHDIRYVVTHDCPLSVLGYIHTSKLIHTKTGSNLDRVASMLTEGVEWFFGHHHMSKFVELNSIKYRLLSIGETYVVEHD